jgi:hypothetical protein
MVGWWGCARAALRLLLAGDVDADTTLPDRDDRRRDGPDAIDDLSLSLSLSLCLIQFVY